MLLKLLDTRHKRPATPKQHIKTILTFSRFWCILIGLGLLRINLCSLWDGDLHPCLRCVLPVGVMFGGVTAGPQWSGLSVRVGGGGGGGGL